MDILFRKYEHFVLEIFDCGACLPGDIQVSVTLLTVPLFHTSTVPHCDPLHCSANNQQGPPPPKHKTNISSIQTIFKVLAHLNIKIFL